jgi:hypothetical protein
MRALLLFISLCPYLFSESISFSDLGGEWNQKEIHIRGFLYKTDGDQLILAGEPNLRHCCVGSELKRDRQIYINDASLSPQLTVIDLVGKLVFKEGRYTLENARQLEPAPTNHLALFLGSGALILSGLMIFRRRGKSNRDSAR